MLDSETITMGEAEDTLFVEFWNTVLAPKFIRFRHILVGGLTQHSEAVFQSFRSGRAMWRSMSVAGSGIPRSSSL